MSETGSVGAIHIEFDEAQIGSCTCFNDICQFLSSRYKLCLCRILGTGLSGALETYDVSLAVYRGTSYLAVLRDGPGRRPSSPGSWSHTRAQ